MNQQTYTPAQQAALERYRDINTDHEWWEDTYDYFIEIMEGCGFTAQDLGFSGFWCQGDGASFVGYVTNVQNFRAAFPSPLWDAFGALLPEDIRVYRMSSMYYHEYTMLAEVGVPHLDTENMPEGLADLYESQLLKATEELEEFVQETMRGKARDLYRLLEQEYEYLTSEEAVRETLQANDMWPEDLPDGWDTVDCRIMQDLLLYFINGDVSALTAGEVAACEDYERKLREELGPGHWSVSNEEPHHAHCEVLDVFGQVCNVQWVYRPYNASA
jgi:hypothetical protein